MTTPAPATLEREREKLPYPPPFQDLATLAKHICAAENTIERWVRQGEFPGPAKKVGGKNLWSWKQVERFMSQDNNAPPHSIEESIREATARISKRG